MDRLLTIYKRVTISILSFLIIICLVLFWNSELYASIDLDAEADAPKEILLTEAVVEAVRTTNTSNPRSAAVIDDEAWDAFVEERLTGNTVSGSDLEGESDKIEEIVSDEAHSSQEQTVETTDKIDVGLEIEDSDKSVELVEEATERSSDKEIASDQDLVVADDAPPVPGVPLTDAQGMKIAEYNFSKYSYLARQVVDYINQYRAENGILPVGFDDRISLAAMHRAAENAWVEKFEVGTVDGVFHHIRPNGSKASTVFPIYQIDGLYGENMARYHANAYELIYGDYGWKNSATHNAIMLDSRYSKVGVGIAADSEGYLYWVAIFSN